MKFLLAHVLIILGMSKVYAGTFSIIKELVPVAKEGSQGTGGIGDGAGQGTTASR